MSTRILRTASELLVPISLLFAAFIFFKGHQSPGGGFVGGLVVAIALIVHRMAHGADSLRVLLRTNERNLIGAGLLLAVGTGAGSMFFGLPFLTSTYGYLPLPGTEDHVEWATVMIFDLGVLLVVMGVAVGMIEALARELEQP